MLPGIYTYDMASWNEYLSSGTILPHWSITYGYFLAFFLDLGNLLFSSYTIGFALAMLVQLIFISYVLYKIIIFSTTESKNKSLYYISLFFFLFTPFITIMSITDAQDVAFGGFLALLIINICQIIFNAKKTIKKRQIITIILLAFFLTTFRNNGVICLLFCIFALAFSKISAKKILLSSLIAAIMLNFLYTGPFFQLIGVRQNNTAIQEILGVPSQQLARSLYENPSSFNENDISDLNSFYQTQDSSFSSYQSYPLIADFTKSTLNSEFTSSHLSDYLALWLRIGIKNIPNYIEAFLLNSFGFWYPLKDYNDPRINLDYMNYPGFSMTAEFLNEKKHPNMKNVSRVLPDNPITSSIDTLVFGNAWYHMPIIAQISSMGIYTLIIIYFIGILIIQKAYKWIIVFSPIIGLLLTLFVAPVAIYRYIFPIAIILPIFFCSILKSFS